MKSITWIASTLLAGASLVSAHGEPDLKHEHAGDVFRKFHGKQCYIDGPASNGSSTGVTKSIGGEDLYLAYPKRHHKSSAAILYLTDIFGVQLVNNRLLADALAKAGYLVVIPDLFRGDPVPANALSDPNSGFNMTAWRARHPQAQVEEIIASAINSTRNELGATKLGAVGYCFGGKYVARFLAEGKGLDAGFTAHPSNTLANEWESIAAPISIAFGELDASSTPENRTNIETIFSEGNKTFQTALYAQAEHGFAVRTNLTDKRKAFAQESAYLQAVRWFDQWVKDED
ncbi:Putative dienelactone hydrolase, alpha/Beta hydrolase [Septoria linicola]|uniref:Dienelactone hydrolase, alpha/Beta hydrolase n=1 Tax=Septoria linicola TaxID=215465 RepID=A0A9Q9EK58_9PEZI|nr:putative dienelactone hydrolase, alpha/Beta hydrolase [Septoria linicola]USW54466.1 Putative dienelactone hydrolase, alpha/Beta hydrolase [Septoria linicola]